MKTPAAENELTVRRTPAPGCPACAAGRLHTDEEWRTHHPARGTGHAQTDGRAKRAEERKVA